MPHKLLLADDSVTIQRVIELTFADEDIQVSAVGDGKKAIASIQAERPDIVLADVGMPERDGYEVAAFIKANPRARAHSGAAADRSVRADRRGAGARRRVRRRARQAVRAADGHQPRQGSARRAAAGRTLVRQPRPSARRGSRRRPDPDRDPSTLRRGSPDRIARGLFRSARRGVCHHGGAFCTAGDSRAAGASAGPLVGRRRPAPQARHAAPAANSFGRRHRGLGSRPDRRSEETGVNRPAADRTGPGEPLRADCLSSTGRTRALSFTPARLTRSRPGRRQRRRPSCAARPPGACSRAVAGRGIRDAACRPNRAVRWPHRRSRRSRDDVVDDIVNESSCGWVIARSGRRSTEIAERLVREEIERIKAPDDRRRPADIDLPMRESPLLGYHQRLCQMAFY